MSEFLWIGINAHGEKISGKISADNKPHAKQAIEKNDITLLSLKKNSVTFSFQQTKKFSHKQRLDFTQQLHLLLQAGIPLSDGLSLIIKTSQNKAMQTISHTLNEKIISGLPFSTALAEFPHYFEKTYCQMIAAGEQSGQLEIVLAQLIQNEEQTIHLKNKIMKALFYPICVLCIAIIIAIGLLIFVIPEFKSIYDNFGAQLPTMTRYLILMSHYLNQQGIFYITGIPFLFFVIKKIAVKNSIIKNKFDNIFLKIPFLQSILIMRETARWSQLLSMTLSAGIPLIDALHIANQAISQSCLQIQLQNVRVAVIAGKSLHSALEACPHFPLRAKSMIAIGENADSLSFMMQKIAVIYAQNLNDTLDRLSKLLEPVIMIAVASLVSGLIIAMYLPIFKMGSVV